MTIPSIKPYRPHKRLTTEEIQEKIKKKELLNIYDFGQQLLDTLDLDPMYIALYNSSLIKNPKKQRQLKKWLLAYWCYYHCGIASIASEVESDYEYFQELRIYTSSIYPRGKQRRHFRLNNALKSIQHLESVGIDAFFSLLEKCKTVAHVSKVVKKFDGFGPWVAFEIADMIGALGLVKLDFSETSEYMYKAPKKAALQMIAVEKITTATPIGTALRYLKSHFKGQKAPPSFDREIDYQDCETMLCKWGSYLKGRYEIGDDVRTVYKELSYGMTANCDTAIRLYEILHDKCLVKLKDYRT